MRPFNQAFFPELLYTLCDESDLDGAWVEETNVVWATLLKSEWLEMWQLLNVVRHKETV